MTSPPARILVEQSPRSGGEALCHLLEANGYETEVTPFQNLLQTIEWRQFDLVLFDLACEPGDPAEFDLFHALRAIDSNLRLIAMVDSGAVGLGIEAMRRGAHTFLQSSPDNQQLLRFLRSEADLVTTRRRMDLLESENIRLSNGPAGQRLVAVSPAMRSLMDTIGRLSHSDANVLITGERGVEKGVVAAAIHAGSRRSAKPLVFVEPGAFDERAFAAELYGRFSESSHDPYETDRVGRLELANGGTLVLDEIGSIPLVAQGTLLRVLETGEFTRAGSARAQRVDVRVISGTSTSIEEEVANAHFWGDLLSMLSGSSLVVPPLRERLEDIPLLADDFQRRFAARHRKPSRSFDERAVAGLLRYQWPGNVSELELVVERAVLVSSSLQLTLNDLALADPVNEPPHIDRSLEEVEYLLVRKALRRFDGNVSKAAEALGLTRSSMYRRLHRFRL